jgi:hypothetical protein
MTTLILQQPDLIERLQQVASDQNTTAEALLDTAVQDFLDQWANHKIEVEVRAFIQVHPKLIDDYQNQYVAIHNGAVVDHDGNVRALHLRVRQKYGRMPVLLRLVTDAIELPEITVRSPKLSSVYP